MSGRIHPTAMIERDVSIGHDTAVWDHVHIRHDAVIGDSCIIGGKSYIAYGVRIGNKVKINANVYVCHGVTIDDGVMIGAGTVFTNDMFPRATTADLQQLQSSDPNEQTGQTRVGEGATIGAHCTIGNAIDIGRFAMVGMGAVVTRSVPDFALVYGNPARLSGFVCRCGPPLLRFPNAGEHMKDAPDGPRTRLVCAHCDRQYQLNRRRLTED